jgi:hypothetical protein
VLLRTERVIPYRQERPQPSLDTPLRTPVSPVNDAVIPVTMGGKVTLFGEGFDAAVCS